MPCSVNEDCTGDKITMIIIAMLNGDDGDDDGVYDTWKAWTWPLLSGKVQL